MRRIAIGLRIIGRFDIVTKSNWLRALLAPTIAALATLAPNAGHAAPPHAGPVTGVIDAVRYEGDQYYVFGWACQQGNRGAIAVNISSGRLGAGAPPETFMLSGT